MSKEYYKRKKELLYDVEKSKMPGTFQWLKKQ